MKILVVDDERKMGLLVAGALESDNHEVVTVNSGMDAKTRLSESDFDVMVTDLKMAPPDGLELLKFARTEYPTVDVLLMTAYATAKTAVEAMQNGASDYLIKPFELSELRLRIRKLSQSRELDENVRLLTQENKLLKKESGSSPRFGRLIGQSRLIQEVFQLAEKVGGTGATVLIRGESGTGKSLLARAIHDASARREGPLVTVNCGAIPENLLESELFGHEKGAFTGAVAKKQGRFKTAEGGTIFLDEVGELPSPLQVKLLEVLEEKTFYPVGSESPQTADARVIAATNTNLEEAIQDGSFREDLFYRLNVFPIVIPPLAARKDDIAVLLDVFLSRFNKSTTDLTPEARTALMSYGYPGNVRELENLVERAAILAGDEPLTPAHFPGLIEAAQGRPLTSGATLEIPDQGISLEQLEKELILQALDKSGGNKTKAAKLLGLTRRTLYSRLERHGLPL